MQLSNGYECCTTAAGIGTKYEYSRKLQEQFIKGKKVNTRYCMSLCGVAVFIVTN